MKKIYSIIMFVMVIVIVFVLFSEKGIIAMKNLKGYKSDKVTIIIDAGHGGYDPGKIGINKVLEKDINLSIAGKLKTLLEQNDIRVIMTRNNSSGLYTKADRDWKHSDMRNRIKIINTGNAAFAISIHQNSFEQESSRGAQVFYYTNSKEGKLLAETLQEGIKRSIQDGNHRLARPNSSYYLLRQSKCPLAIVECGFLSNRAEANLLCEEEYQNKMAYAIHLSIMEYINKYIKTDKSNLVNR